MGPPVEPSEVPADGNQQAGRVGLEAAGLQVDQPVSKPAASPWGCTSIGTEVPGRDVGPPVEPSEVPVDCNQLATRCPPPIAAGFPAR